MPMDGIPELLLAAGVATVGWPVATVLTDAPTDGAVAGDAADGEIFAMVRFVNNTPGSASVAIDGRTVFLMVSTGRVTDYAVVSAPLAAFTLTTTDPGRDPVTITQRLEDSGRYTLTARMTLDGSPAFTIRREEEFVAEPQPEW